MKLKKIIAAGLGTGYSPIAPGTAGAILGIIVLFFLNKQLVILGFPMEKIVLYDLLAIIFFTLAGVYSIRSVHKIWPHDDNRIVIDEIIGVWIAALALPVDWKYYLGALIAFRFFDIVKPFFIKKFDQMVNDWSVMLDDLLAGIYAMIVMQMLLHSGCL